MKPVLAVIVSLLLVFETSSSSVLQNPGEAVLVCDESEREALLRFKQELKDPTNRLSSWDPEGGDCCKWVGIFCDSETGHVRELSLFASPPHRTVFESDGEYYAAEDAYQRSKLRGKISESLLNLTHLTHLDLSSNDFGGIPIPKFIGSLRSLRYLNLSGAGFGGMIPHQLGNLSALSLDLSFNPLNSSLPSSLFSLQTLEDLKLAEIGIGGPIPCGFRNMTALKYLDLSNNNLDSSIPICLYGFAHLQTLRLFDNNLQGELSSGIQNLTSLVHLDLSSNKLEGEIPKSIGNLCNLKEIYLGSNKFGGLVWKAIESFSSGCAALGLQSLDLSDSVFLGQMRDDQFQHFGNLRNLHLHKNSITGPLPISIGGLSNLESLSIDRNDLEGTVTELHFANLTNLVNLCASVNSLVLRVDSDWIPPFQLQRLYLGSWLLGPQFPLWLRSQNQIWYLDLSRAQLSGTVPSWFWNLSSNLAYLNLSHNQIHGQIPNSINLTERSSIFLSSNQFSGPLPHINPNVSVLDLSNNSFSGEISDFLCNQTGQTNSLNILHLGDNQLSGKIPDCWKNWSSLESINLSNNNLTGEIPGSIGDLDILQVLQLRDNNLSGILPSSLRNCTSLFILNIAKNQFHGRIPTWIGSSLSKLMVLIIRSNKFDGQIPSELCQLNSLRILDTAGNNLSGKSPKCFNNFTAMAETRNVKVTALLFYGGLEYTSDVLENARVTMKGNEVQYDSVLALVRSLDLSDNNLSGEIPEEVTSLVGLVSLNFSNNKLIGRIPDKMGDMSKLESLDLSRNKLVGQIPPTMSALSFLSYLNLSYNMLSGKIPLGTQIQSFGASSFIGNKFCGPPLTESCTVRDQTTPPAKEDEEEEVVDWMIVFTVLGVVVGFGAIWVPLLCSKTWRYGYFRFLDSMWLKLESAVISVWFLLKGLVS